MFGRLLAAFEVFAVSMLRCAEEFKRMNDLEEQRQELARADASLTLRASTKH